MYFFGTKLGILKPEKKKNSKIKDREDPIFPRGFP